MWKPTKKQHLTNKKYVDENGGGSGSGLDVFVVNFTTDSQTEAYACDKTMDEILAANAAGKVVMGLVKRPGTANLVFTYEGQVLDANYVTFVNYAIYAKSSGSGGSIMVVSLFVNPDGTVANNTKQITIS